jgi:ParB family chromosome partitioning protein
MVKMAKKTGLGMGLDALFEDNGSDLQGSQTVRLSEIEPNKNQPRQNFDEASIASLAESIREHGLIQPILVRPIKTGGYQIVAGERRWRACRMLGMAEVPVIIKELSDFETAQIALIENVQRENLNPIEEATAYKTLMENFHMTQETLSKAVGKSRSVIANAVRLLNLPEVVQDMLKSGDISVGQAKALASIVDEKLLVELAEKASKGQVTVRGIEKITAEMDKGQKAEADKAEDKRIKNYFTEMQLSLNERLGRKVKISGKNNGKGSIIIDFYDRDDLAELAHRLTGE